MDATHLQTVAWRDVMHWALSDGVPMRSLKIAIVVGAILNIINQGDALVSEAPLDWAKIALTFCVPYFVSTYGAVSYRLNASRRLAAGGGA